MPVKDKTVIVWRSMHDRCNLQSQKSYRDYGGRGIRVCERWAGSQGFANFLADMGPRPDGMTIDRINNDGNYEPGNCRWISRHDQAGNKRNNRFITANGETLHLAEWARRLKCNPSAILARLDTGMSEEEAVTKAIPERPNSKLVPDDVRFIRANYPLFTAQKLADRFGVSKKTVLNVLHRTIFKDIE